MYDGIKEQTLIEASIKGDVGLVKAMLDEGTEPDCWLVEGLTPLLYAVKSGNNNIVSLLLKRGANPELAVDNSEGTKGMRAFRLSLFLGNIEAAALISGCISAPLRSQIVPEQLIREKGFFNDKLILIVSDSSDKLYFVYHRVDQLMLLSETGENWCQKNLFKKDNRLFLNMINRYGREKEIELIMYWPLLETSFEGYVIFSESYGSTNIKSDYRLPAEYWINPHEEVENMARMLCVSNGIEAA